MLRELESNLLYHPIPSAGKEDWEFGCYRFVPSTPSYPIKEPLPTFFCCHGNTGNAAQRLYWTGVFGPGHYYIHEYSGFGTLYNTDTLPNKKDIMTRVMEAIEDVLPHTEGDLFLLGESLGTGIVCEVASVHQVQGIILITPYSTMTAMAHRILPIVGPVLLKDRYNTVHWLRKIRRSYSPVVTIIAGNRDQLTPPKQAVQVAEAAETKVDWYDGNHQDAWLQKRQWLQKVKLV